jgi:exodeoxyribonuclease VII large subunit
MDQNQAPKIFQLSVITRRIQEILAPVSSKTFWVRAEITSGRHKGGSFYCDLIEADDNGSVIARMRCNLWNRDLQRIQNKFKEQNIELQLDDGTSAIFCCQLQFSPQYGISLKVVDADPAFAMGELEKRKQEILAGLQRDGLLDINKQLDVPSVPMRIGLITSSGSAACSDFLKTIGLSGYNYTVYLADSLVQGAATENSILRALHQLKHSGCDLVVIIRGGGSKTDLSYLDNDSIARQIAHYPIPVWTGIGHEIDISVLDHVAHRFFKTPTAVAEELVARSTQTDRYLSESAERLKTIWTFRLQQNQQWVERAVTGIKNGTRKMLDLARSELREVAMAPWSKVSDRLADEQLFLNQSALLIKQHLRSRFQDQRFAVRDLTGQLKTASRRIIEHAQHQFLVVHKSLKIDRVLQRIKTEDDQLSYKLSTIQAHAPQRIINKGFALLTDVDDQIITNTTQVKLGQKINIAVKDGRLKTTVDDIVPGKEEA